MIRGAAKNHESVTVVVEPEDYERLLAEIAANNGATTLAFRKELAAKAFARSAAYDAAISNWFATRAQINSARVARLRRPARAGAALRRERRTSRRRFIISDRSQARRRDCQSAAGQGTLLQQHQRHGCRVRARLRIRRQVPAVAIIKHANPCGVAVAHALKDAYLKALASDPVSAFGGIIALNQPIDARSGRGDHQDLH